MRYKLLGKSGLRVSELCLGAMTFGDEWGWGASKDESRRIYETFLEAGGNFIDTANAYTEGTSERFLGQWPAAQQAYERARKLCDESSPEATLFPVLWGLWLVHKVRSNLGTARLLADAP